MRRSICRFTPPQWEGHDDKSGYFTTDIITEESILLVESESYEEDEEKLALMENEARKVWDEQYASQMVPVDPDDNVEIKISSNIRADFESSVIVTTNFALLRMTLFHGTKHNLYYLDGLGDHGVGDMQDAFLDAYSGISPVDVLWVDAIECEDLEKNRNRIAELLIHLRDDFVCNGIVALDKAKHFEFLPGFEKIEKYLYYGKVKSPEFSGKTGLALISDICSID